MSMSSFSRSILSFSLRLTKFAGQNKIPVLDWVLAWATVILFGFRYIVEYAGLRWKLYLIARRVVKSTAPPAQATTTTTTSYGQQQIEESSLCDCISLCPLAHTRVELSVGIQERWERLRRVLFMASSVLANGDDSCEEKDANNKTKTTNRGAHGGGSGETASEQSSLIDDTIEEWTDEDWIKIVRSNLTVRKEASYLMFALGKHSRPSPLPRNAAVVLSTLRRLWPSFLELPRSVVEGIGSESCGSNNDGPSTADSTYDISVIVPMYQERICDIGYTLQRALENCTGDPKTIQLVVVHAESRPNENAAAADAKGGGGENSLLRRQLLLEEHKQQSQQDQPQNRQPALADQHDNATKTNEPSQWGELKVVTIPFGEAGGRGKTLNVGARQATAPILTFLHADTIVPPGWDEQIKGALSVSSSSSEDGFFPHACAFTMSIDDAEELSSQSSSPSSNHHETKVYRSILPGLLGAEWLGVLRCHCGLPYGDSVLSFSRPMFDYMGGFPAQPLMEDYETMYWLRLRSIILSTIYGMTAKKEYHHSSNDKNKAIDSAVGVTRAEGLVLLRDRARCSPRRWRKYGVAYTSLVNAICVVRYKSGVMTEELFDFYYNSDSKPSSQKK